MNILMIFTIIILTFNLWSSEKPIQDIEKGDFVYTQNIETGEVEFKEVLDTFIREVDKLIILELENGDKIETTEEHPFWVVGENDYIEARKLRINDELLLVNQQKVKVRDFKIRILSRVIKVYNFEVEGNHNYFVGSGVLVHNANCGDDVTVGRWMQKTEYDNMVKTGTVQESWTGTTHVAIPAKPEAYMKQAKVKAHYVEFDVPASSIKPGEGTGWGKILGPNTSQGRLAKKNGRTVPQMPKAKNIKHLATKIRY